jgi:hypothetical protein
MSRYLDRDTYSQAGDWLLGTARRNPEALLLFAAGCCLLMRGGASSSSRRASYGADETRSASNRSSDFTRYPSTSREGLASRASDYASQIKDRVSDTASSYAESVSDFAEDARRNISESSEGLKRKARSTMQSGMDRVLSNQPLAVAMAGLAAGAAVAALFPSTDIEDRAFGDAREALTDAAGAAGRRVIKAAGQAGEHLKTAAEERGLTSEGFKELAGEVTETFTSAVSGKSDDQGGATPPNNAATGTAPNQSFGAGQGKPPDANRSSDPGRAGFEPGRGNR